MNEKSEKNFSDKICNKTKFEINQTRKNIAYFWKEIDIILTEQHNL